MLGRVARVLEMESSPARRDKAKYFMHLKRLQKTRAKRQKALGPEGIRSVRRFLLSWNREYMKNLSNAITERDVIALNFQARYQGEISQPADTKPIASSKHLPKEFSGISPDAIVPLAPVSRVAIQK